MRKKARQQNAVERSKKKAGCRYRPCTTAQHKAAIEKCRCLVCLTKRSTCMPLSCHAHTSVTHPPVRRNEDGIQRRLCPHSQQPWLAIRLAPKAAWFAALGRAPVPKIFRGSVPARVRQALSCGRKIATALPTDHLQTVKNKKPRYFLNSRVSLLYLGWLMGLEPTTTGITILDSTN